MRRPAFVLLAGMLLPAWFLGCSDGGRLEREGTDWIAPAALELDRGLSFQERAGHRDFGHYCAICHGDLGEGDGFNSFNLDPKPRDLVDVFKQLGKDQVAKTIGQGTAALGRSPQCPPWGLTLSPEAVDDLVLFIGAIERVRPRPAEGAAPPESE